MTQETLEQQLQRELIEYLKTELSRYFDGFHFYKEDVDNHAIEITNHIIATTIQRVRESERDKHVWLGFQQSGEGYNYEYWGQRPIEELKDEVIKKALSLLDLLKDNPE